MIGYVSAGLVLICLIRLYQVRDNIKVIPDIEYEDDYLNGEV